MSGQQGVLGKGAGTVALAIFRRQLLQIEKVRATHQPFHARKSGVLRRSGGAVALILEFPGQETAQRIAGFMIISREVG